MTPQTYTWFPPSAILSKTHSPYSMCGEFVQVSRYLFGGPEQIEAKALRDNFWREEPSESSLLVERLERLNLKEVERRPAILVRRDRFTTVETAIGEGGDFGAQEATTDGVPYQLLWTGSISFITLAKTPSEAELLAEELGSKLTSFRPRIRADLCLLRFAHLETGPVGKLKEAQEHFAVTQTYGTAFWQTWLLAEEAPTLKRFEVVTEIK